MTMPVLSSLTMIQISAYFQLAATFLSVMTVIGVVYALKVRNQNREAPVKPIPDSIAAAETQKIVLENQNPVLSESKIAG